MSTVSTGTVTNLSPLTTTVVLTQACPSSIVVLPTLKSDIEGIEEASAAPFKDSELIYPRRAVISSAFTTAQNFLVTSSGDDPSIPALVVDSKHNANDNIRITICFIFIAAICLL